jgi:hypothetical protein
MGDDIFVKMYVRSFRSGMVADMGAERWQTLCVLASFMNEEGKCWPTQDLLARELGVARETANRRVQKLLKYRWNGLPVIEMETIRHPVHKTWLKTIYTILPNSCLYIFNNVTPQESHGKRHSNYNHINENYIN